MECYYCGGPMTKKTASYTANRQHYHLILDNIPAWVCEQCGEVYFEEAEVEEIQNLLREADRRVEALVKQAA